jgi:glucose/arabinose dehydrogenase
VIRAGGKFVLALGLLLGLWTSSAYALTAQSIGNFDQPVYVTSAPANPDRLFVVERGGSIVVAENGEVKPFATLPVSKVGEGGLLSIAFAPDFATSGRLFVYYTGPQAENPDIHVAELVAGGSGVPLSSLRNLLTIEHPNKDNHYGGQLQFGPEGNLFISTGDGGGRDDLEHNAQDLGSLLGKILRIDPDPGATLPYTVPAGNPFAANPAPYDTIWSYGLRNPFRFSFDQQTGDLWIGDVGQETREEVDFAAAPGLNAGANYGWNCREGSQPGPPGDPDPECAGTTEASFVPPVFDYVNPTQGCAVIGGYVARGPGFGDLLGRYVYGDLCAGNIRSFSLASPYLTDRSEGVHIESLNSFGEDSCGRLYAVSGEGPVYRLLGSGAATCGGVTTAATLTPSLVRVRAASRKVKRKRRALISAWVSPCNGRHGGRVTLWRGRRNLGTRRLDRVCSAHFRPQIKRRSSFRVTLKADQAFAGAISRRLTIRPLRRLRHR